MSPVKSKSKAAADDHAKIAEMLDEPVNVALSPFDSLGKIRDFSAETSLIEAMPAEQRAIFFSMIADARAAEEAEARVVELRRAVYVCMHQETVAKELADKNRPLMTAQMELRNAIAANEGRSEREKPRPVNPKFAAELARVSAELLKLRQEFQAATDEAKALSKTRADAIARYLRTQPITTPEANIRRHIDAAVAHRAGLADGSIAGPAPEPLRHVWPIEAARAKKGANGHQVRSRTFLGKR